MNVNVLSWARTHLWVTTAQHETTAPEFPLSPALVQRGMRLSLIEGALSMVHVQLTLTTGIFVTGFALLLSATEFELGILGALPFAGQMFQFVGAYLEERLGERRRFVTLSALFGRLLWILIALLPFLAGLGAMRLPIFLALVALSQALLGITINGWMSWMSDLVPQRQRGFYFGMRNTIATIAAMVSSWMAGWAVDHFLQAGTPQIGYALIFGGACLCAAASAAILWWQPEPLRCRHRRIPARELLCTPMRHPRFRVFCLAATGWGLATGIALPFFNVYGLQTLKLSFTTLALTGIIMSVVTLISQPLVGRLQDRYGNKRVLVISVLGAVILPLGWVVATPSFLLPIWIASILAGAFWPGITQGLFNLVLERSPVEGRGAYIAVHSVMLGAGTFTASLLGGALATLFPAMLMLGPFAIGQYAFLFVLSCLGRALMAYIFWKCL